MTARLLKEFLPAVSVALIILGGCSKRFVNQPIADQPPRTFLALVPDSTLRSSVSEQHIHWWGVDPDGFVIGFYFSFDSARWTYTTKTDSVFNLRLNTTDTLYRFFVQAVDNDGSRDPNPASVKYPIHNSPPSVSFVLNSNVPETTYTVASFQWQGTDPDGNETIVNYYYALDDTSNPSNWRSVPGTASLVTLYQSDGLTQGNHIFFLRARDIAGAFSKTIRMPDTNKVWYVKQPRGDFLIIRDYQLGDFAATFYSQMFDTLMGGRVRAKDVIDIKIGSSSVSRGKYVPALINPTFTSTLELFKYVFWYADNAPSLDIAQASLPKFKRDGGKVLFCAGFPQNVTTQGGMGDFAPIDNIEPGAFTTILLQRDTILNVDASYPLLVRDTLGAIYMFPRGLFPKVDARVLYQMQKSSRWASRDTTPIIMGVKDADVANFVLLAAQLHRFGTPRRNVATFLRRVFQGEFGIPSLP